MAEFGTTDYPWITEEHPVRRSYPLDQLTPAETTRLYTNGWLVAVAVVPESIAVGNANPRDVPVGIFVNREDGTTESALVDVTPKQLVRLPVANVLTYSGGTPDTFAATVSNGVEVYLDNSAALGDTTSLSLSPLNDAGDANPLWGRTSYSFTYGELPDTPMGNATITTAYPVTAGATLTIVSLTLEMK